ncbi:MAG: sporulation protein YqfD [Clostridia bacterium]|nr:sporulation protein YqfD [Clostridia bacterium]
MLLLKFIRFLTGYVVFSARGGFPERFINLCRLKKINLWELKSSGSVIYACTDCREYKRIRHCARQSGMKIRIQKKCGLPFFLNRHRRRAGVLAGIFICVAVICILSTRIWSIEVTGNVDVPSEAIIGTFEKLGVRKGASGNRVDVAKAEIEALKELDELSWVNVNFEGSAAVIEVREREKVPDESDETPSEIVAARDGQIIVLRPFNGTQAQKIGNGVLKGDLLISGIEENKDLTVSFCRARGYVVACTERELECSVNKNFEAERKSAETTAYIIEFFGFEIPLGKTGEASYTEKTSLRINGVTLPLGFTKCLSVGKEKCTVNLESGQVKLLAALRFSETCAEEFRYLKVKSEKVSVNEKADGITVGGEFVCIENIGKEVPLEIEETE